MPEQYKNAWKPHQKTTGILALYYYWCYQSGHLSMIFDANCGRPLSFPPLGHLLPLFRLPDTGTYGFICRRHCHDREHTHYPCHPQNPEKRGLTFLHPSLISSRKPKIRSTTRHKTTPLQSSARSSPSRPRYRHRVVRLMPSWRAAAARLPPWAATV